MKKASEVTLTEFRREVRRKIRPTVKVFLFNRKGEVLFFHREGRFSLPGGGIDDGELLSFALVRELSEELLGVNIRPRKAREALILRVGNLPTTKPDWKGKRVWVLGIYLKDIKAITIHDDNHYDLKILSFEQAIKYIENHTSCLSRVLFQSPTATEENAAASVTRPALFYVRL